MSLIVEDGSGVTGAESYLSIADVGTYAGRFGLTWTGTDAEKEAAARTAALYLDIVYETRLGGSRVTQSQSLAWPRFNVEDSEFDSYPADGYGWGGGAYVASNVVPQAWKDAHAEMSVKARVENILPDVTESGSMTSKDVQVGPIRVAKAWSGGISPTKYYRKVDLMLRRYLGAGNELKRA